MSYCQRTTAVLMAVASLAGLPTSAQADLITIDPRATYLRTSSDNALDAVAIDLLALSFPVNQGNTILLERIGDYSPFSAFGDSNKSMVGVFSSSATLLTGNTLNRVGGAIDAGTDFVTAPTAFGGLTTDITQDFLISTPTGSVSSLLLQVPVGARFLFATPHDSFFGDNIDPNGNYGIRITSGVPEPSSLALFGVGALFVVVAGWRRRSQGSEVDCRAV